MDWWAGIQSGSIYAGLRKLEKDGLIEVVETGRDGNRPTKRVYAITDRGRTEFQRMLREAWVGIARFARPIDLAVSFYDALDREEIEELLEQRLRNLEILRGAFDIEHMPPLENPAQREVVVELRDHEHRLISAEIEWTKSLLERLRGSVYPASYDARAGGKGHGKGRTAKR